MKKIIYISLFLFAIGTVSVAQDKKESASTSSDKTNVEPIKPWDDPKISEADRQKMKLAERENPVKITQPLAADSKKDAFNIPSENTTTIIWKAEPLPPLEEREPVVQQKNSGSSQRPFTGSEQPAGNKSGSVTNYREMNGPSEQPEGTKSQTITDYRNMNGKNTQPQGKPSGK
ncbi:MAG: hypothetical protein FJY07_04170 [Bacteroidetes bacterium]|nr:hypothetical protein [Bacteroidota bacterium]